MPENVIGIPSVTVTYGGELGIYEVEPGVTLKLRAEEAADLYPGAKQLDAPVKAKVRKSATVKNKVRTVAKAK